MVQCLETFKLEIQTKAQVSTVGRCCMGSRAVVPRAPYSSPLQCVTGMERRLPARTRSLKTTAKAAAFLSGLRVSDGTLRNCRQKLPSRARIKMFDLFIMFQAG